MNSTCDRDDSIICQLPTGTQRAASLLLRRVPLSFWLEYLRMTKADLLTSLSRTQLLHSLYYPSICISLFLGFFLFILVLLPLAFYVSYKRVLSVNSNYPPFLSLNQSFGYHTCFSLPSKQLWLWCWPRFTVLLQQYVALCFGFLGMVYECTHSSVIVYSPKSTCQFVINVNRQAVWLY